MPNEKSISKVPTKQITDYFSPEVGSSKDQPRSQSTYRENNVDETPYKKNRVSVTSKYYDIMKVFESDSEDEIEIDREMGI